MRLSRLIGEIEPIQLIGLDGLDPEINAVRCRSGDVRQGDLFVAIHGLAADGHDFAEMAVEKGASVVVSQKPLSIQAGCIVVKDSRKALAALADAFFDKPSEKMTLIGVTGTNGKTTTAFLIENILKSAGFEVGLIGTILCRYGKESTAAGMTTPESLELQEILHRMQRSNVTHVVMEVSSHALSLSRVDHCRMDVGVFTNLSRDHLDFHKDMESYWKSKRLLFTDILKTGSKKGKSVAVVNRTGEKGKELFQTISGTRISVGMDPDNMVSGRIKKSDIHGINAVIVTPAGEFEICTPLAGMHNLENILCAAGAGIAQNISLEIIKSGIETMTLVPGRFERISDITGRNVIVDYAHTPAALEHVLKTLRMVASGILICIFGCGGERDREKRSQMGEIAGRLSDLVIVTSDNPRREDPLEIIAQIESGVVGAGLEKINPSELTLWTGRPVYLTEPDRRNAILLGVGAAKPGDSVLIAGKGHEPYQIIGQKTFPFDDREEAKHALSFTAHFNPGE
ncbi:MAG: UDP-N-acetylmuramoyl-L-alanyl-D-glutamate--2,6-diaminopimelate ligase [Thermodesulfobacteriota bacterium]